MRQSDDCVALVSNSVCLKSVFRKNFITVDRLFRNLSRAIGRGSKGHHPQLVDRFRWTLVLASRLTLEQAEALTVGGSWVEAVGKSVVQVSYGELVHPDRVEIEI